MKAKPLYWAIGVCLVCMVWGLPLSGDMSSDSYIVPIQVIDSGGAQSTSTGFTNTGAVGQATPIGFSQSTSFRLRAGYIAQVAGLKPCWDRDGDRYFDEACGGDDCDDTDFDINPGPQEGPPTDPTCTDGIDNDCDGLTDLEDEADCVCWDADGDGYTADTCGGTDCDDTDPEVNPGAQEGPPSDPSCDDGVDNDCDEEFDWYDLGCYGYLLELDADYVSGYLALDYTIATIGPATWLNYLILTSPSVQVIPLWSIQLPNIYPPIDIPISFPLPSMGWVGIYTCLYPAEGAPICKVVWVNT